MFESLIHLLLSLAKCKIDINPAFKIPKKKISTSEHSKIYFPFLAVHFFFFLAA